MTSSTSLRVGQRLLINSERCTIRWLGRLPNLPFERIGIEWDTMSKGKHDGEYQGQRYFQTQVSGAGSFIKRPAVILEREGVVQIGFDLLMGIKERYLDGVGVEDIQVPLSSQPNVKIETRGWEQVQKKLSQTDTLRLISVSDTLVSRIVESEEVRRLLPGLEELDLSRTLIYDWYELMKLCKDYTSLTTLRLDGNRFQLITEIHNEAKDSFQYLVTLTLNDCLFTIEDVNNLAPYLTHLKVLQLSANKLTSVPSPFNLQSPWFPALETLVLSDNLITGIESDSLRGLEYYKCLRYLDLSYNPLSQFSSDSLLSSSLQRLNINYGNITQWREFGTLPKLFPNLNHLQALENPAVKSSLVDTKVAIGGSGSISRITLIAMIPTLNQLNMSNISNQERTDAELFYLHQICQPQLNTIDDFKLINSQYDRLCKLYDINHQIIKPSSKGVKHRLITLNLVLHNILPPTQSDSLSTDTILNIPPIQQTHKQFLRSANVRTLQLSIPTLFKLSPTTKLDLYGLLPYDQNATLYQIIPLDNPIRQFHQFYQLQDQDIVWVTIKN